MARCCKRGEGEANPNTIQHTRPRWLSTFTRTCHQRGNMVSPISVITLSSSASVPFSPFMDVSVSLGSHFRVPPDREAHSVVTRMRGFPKCMSHHHHPMFTGISARAQPAVACVHVSPQPRPPRVTAERETSKRRPFRTRRTFYLLFTCRQPAARRRGDRRERRSGAVRGKEARTAQGIVRDDRGWLAPPAVTARWLVC